MLRSVLGGRFDEKKVYILTSSPRSGSTLLSQVLKVIPDSCVLFEPLQLEHVPQAKAAGFTWRTYVEREKDWPEGKEFLKRVFEGEVLNDWTSREMSFLEAIRSKRMIVKFVRANRVLPWICYNFSVPAPVLLLRHPCAVVASQINYGWKGASVPRYPRYLEGYPEFQAALAGVEGDEEYLAATWALDQLPALLDEAPHPWTVVTYEELVLRPDETLARIFTKWGIKVDIEEALRKISKPSRVVSSSGVSGVSGWKKKLTKEQSDRILRTVNRFGIGFYSRDDEADYKVLHSKQLSKVISAAGTRRMARENSE